MPNKKLPRRTVETLTGTVANLDAPNKDPGGGLGPTYLEFGLIGKKAGRVYNGVFYIDISKPGSAEHAANAARAFVTKAPATVRFTISGGWDPKNDPSAVVQSVEI